MPRFFRACQLAAVLTLFVFPPYGRGGEFPAPIVRASASEVRIKFLANDERGHVQTDLKEDDFAVVDNGVVIRRWSSLTAPEDSLDIVLLMDTSESIGRRLQQIAQTALQLVSAKGLARNASVSVMAFRGTRSRLLCNNDCRDSTRDLLLVSAAGATPLFDAISEASSFLEDRHRPQNQPVIVLFSDGIDTSSRSSMQDAMQTLIDSEIVLYAVDVNGGKQGEFESGALRRMAEATGGGYLALGKHVSGRLLNALEAWGHSYVLTYKLQHAREGLHSLQILPTHNLNLQFHCRSSYYYETR